MCYGDGILKRLEGRGGNTLIDRYDEIRAIGEMRSIGKFV